MKHFRGISREKGEKCKNPEGNAGRPRSGSTAKIGVGIHPCGVFYARPRPPGPKMGQGWKQKTGARRGAATGAACPRFPPPNAALQRARDQPAARRGGRRPAISNRARKTRLFSRQQTSDARGTLWIFIFGPKKRVIFCGSPGDFPGFSCDFRDFPRVCRGGNPRIAHGFQRISGDFRGFPRIFRGFSMYFNGFRWISMDFNGFQWISMDSNRPGASFARQTGRSRPRLPGLGQLFQANQRQPAPICLRFWAPSGGPRALAPRI